MVIDFYKKLANESANNIKNARKTLLMIQLSRVLFFACFLIFFILSLSNSFFYFYFSGVSLLGFILLININRKFENKTDFFKRRLLACERELGIIKNDIPPQKTKLNKIESNHPFAFDLDVLGKNSLFSRLNRTNSEISENLLLESITNLCDEIDQIYIRQNSIKELSRNFSLIIDFNTIASQYFENKSDVRLIGLAIKDQTKKINYALIICAIALTLATISTLILGIIQVLPHQYWIILFVINVILSYWVKQKNADKTLNLDQSIAIFKKYEELASFASQFNFQDDQLNNFSKNFSKDQIFLGKLISILTFEKSSNFITNGFLLLDIHLTKKVQEVKLKYPIDFEQLVFNICQIEELISLTFFKFNNPTYTFPSIINKPGTLNVDKLGHPFVLKDNCITNDYYNEAKVNVITGSNMSGKSTFLRSLGINFVLAHIGAPVFASRFETSLGALFTSIKTIDSLDEKKSFFYSEVLRLSEIQKKLKEKKWALVLLDETLKGTNSEDKLSGSIALAKRFSTLNCLLFFATHDSKLGLLEEQNKKDFRNYCFESKVENNKVVFDFKLRKGITKSKNATFILKSHGVID
jgi:hypothetical protein